MMTKHCQKQPDHPTILHALVGQLYTGKDETHGIERDNARQRHWLARFRRRSIVVSKVKRMVDVSMALFARFAGNAKSRERQNQRPHIYANLRPSVLAGARTSWSNIAQPSTASDAGELVHQVRCSNRGGLVGLTSVIPARLLESRKPFDHRREFDASRPEDFARKRLGLLGRMVEDERRE